MHVRAARKGTVARLIVRRAAPLIGGRRPPLNPARRPPTTEKMDGPVPPLRAACPERPVADLVDAAAELGLHAHHLRAATEAQRSRLSHMAQRVADVLTTADAVA